MASDSSFRGELRALVRLAVPLAAAQAGTNLMGLVDVAVLGRSGARQLAAAGLGNAIFFAVSVIGMGLVFGIDPLISQALGAGDRVRARRAFWQGIWLALCVSVILTIVAVLAAYAFPAAGVQHDLIAESQQFLLIRAISLAPFLMFLVARAYLQAHGRTTPMLVAMITANIFNFLLDLWFVFGWGPVPAMGVGGAALSTVVCSFLQLAIVSVAVRRMRIDGVDHRWHAGEVWTAFKVGLPVGLQLGAEIGVFALVGVLAARLGTLQLASHQLVLSLASFTYTLALGVAAAGSVRVGRAVGANDAIATRRAGMAAFIGGIVIMSLNAAAFGFAPQPLARLVTNQQSVIAAALPLFVVAAFFQLSDGIQAVGAGVLRGAGDTKFAFYANLLGHWFIGLPIALLLGFHLQMGIVGLWWGLCAGLTVVAALLFYRFERLSSRAIAPL
ncbi:MAG TPA: MATE family efflux transporter [Thermoanaerobaculia bacterium]|nr:MATE family efflux transporter [Thermoanaerobaculia bacterium]